MKTAELLTEKEQSLSKNLNTLTKDGDMMFYLVQDATPNSEGGDVISHVDGSSFAHIFVGGGHGKTAGKENWTLYHENKKKEAIADANKRLKAAKSDYVVTEGTLKMKIKELLKEGKMLPADINLAIKALLKYGKPVTLSLNKQVVDRHLDREKRNTRSVPIMRNGRKVGGNTVDAGERSPKDAERAQADRVNRIEEEGKKFIGQTAYAVTPKVVAALQKHSNIEGDFSGISTRDGKSSIGLTMNQLALIKDSHIYIVPDLFNPLKK